MNQCYLILQPSHLNCLILSFVCSFLFVHICSFVCLLFIHLSVHLFIHSFIYSEKSHGQAFCSNTTLLKFFVFSWIFVNQMHFFLQFIHSEFCLPHRQKSSQTNLSHINNNISFNTRVCICIFFLWPYKRTYRGTFKLYNNIKPSHLGITYPRTLSFT